MLALWALALVFAGGCSSEDESVGPASAETDAAGISLAVEADGTKPPYDRGVVLVRLGPGVQIRTINQRYGTRTLERLELEPSFRLRVPAGTTVDELLPELTADPDVDYCGPDFELQNPEAQGSSMTFADPSLTNSDYSDQDALARIHAKEAQAQAKGEGVIVAILDTGVDASHPRLRNRIAAGGMDLIEGDADPSDVPDGVDSDGDGLTDEAVGHGTFVAGLVLSVAPRARVLPIRVLDSDGIGTAFALARGIEAAHKGGARVVNMSLGAGVTLGVVDELIEKLKSRDVVFVASAGNQNTEQQQFPARDSHVIGTTAVDDRDKKASFANFGSWVDVSAPGAGVVSTFPGGFAQWSGTSFSSAFVSGEAALLLSASPGARFNDVVDAVEEGTVDVDGKNPRFDGELGEGRIDVLKALRLMR